MKTKEEYKQHAIDYKVDGFICDFVPSLHGHVKAGVILLPCDPDMYFVVHLKNVFLLKQRCLTCFHFKTRNGCGIGIDCKSICLVPEQGSIPGWVSFDDPRMTRELLVTLSKVVTLQEPALPDFIKEQIPPGFTCKTCEKYILLKPIVYRMLVDLEDQAVEIKKKGDRGQLPRAQVEKFMVELEIEREELEDRLLLMF